MARTIDRPPARPPRRAAGERDRPWWHSGVKVIVACAAATLLGVGAGMAFSRPSVPGLTSIDVRFLQDMRWHHDQGVGMALTMIKRADSSSGVRQRAQEILLDQQLENGAMVQLLNGYGAPEANETDTAMEWMSGLMPPTSPNEMPGMATPDQLDQLAQATGVAADKLFLTLMIAHHQGGVHMASYAAQHARTKRVREIAGGIVTSQRSEITDLQGVLAQLH